MGDISQTKFEYAGRKYALEVSLQTGDETLIKSLDNSAIECLEYETAVNGLVQTGSVVYVDGYGAIDRFLEKQETFVKVFFVEVDESYDSDVLIEFFSDKKQFSEIFLVKSVGVLSRDSNKIKYKIDFVSQNIYNCQALLDYSNYAAGGATIFDTLKDCISLAGLSIDKNTFDAVTTDVKLKYITNGNDCLFSIARYLLNRLYYYKTKDDSFKFLIWDHINKNYRLLDMKTRTTFNGDDKIVLSMMKQDMESMTQPERSQLATITKFGQDMALHAFSALSIDTYDGRTNLFGRADVGTKDLVGYYGSSFRDSPECIQKVYDYMRKPYGLNFARRGSYWNNDFDVYDSLTTCLMKNNGLLVDIAGDIGRLPGQRIMLCVDRDSDAVTNEDPVELKDKMTRYRGLEGIWISSRVHTYVYPSKNKFRQALSLMRNFTIDLDNFEI